MNNMGDAYPHRTGSGEILDNEQPPVNVVQRVGGTATREALKDDHAYHTELHATD